jgi:type I restriction enzyme, S subunit
MNTIFESTEEIYGRLPEAWQLTTLGELIKNKKADLQTGPFGTMLHASSYKSIGTPVLAVQHIGENRIIHKWDIPRVDVETHQRLSRYEIKVNDIIFSRKGAVERTALVTQKEKGWLQGSDCIRLRLLDPSIDPVYISYVFCSVAYRKWIIQHAHGATMPSLNQQIINLSPLPIPQLGEQKRIADVLSCLDAKIDNLRRQNETLEEIARSIFKHWFIDFEFPNADGKPYKSFGGAMVRSELGDIPEGWRVGKLGDVGKIITGKTPSTQSPELWGDDLPFITPTDFKNYGKYILGAERKISRLASSKFKNYIIPKNSIIVTCIGSDMGKVVKTAISCITNQQINSIILFDKIYFHEYVFNYLKNQYKLLRNIALGGSTMPIINKSAFSDIEIIIPCIESLNIFENIISPLNDKIINNDSSIQTLTKTRDALLPKLMSGQLRVKE